MADHLGGPESALKRDYGWRRTGIDGSPALRDVVRVGPCLPITPPRRGPPQRRERIRTAGTDDFCTAGSARNQPTDTTSSRSSAKAA